MRLIIRRDVVSKERKNALALVFALTVYLPAR